MRAVLAIFGAGVLSLAACGVNTRFSPDFTHSPFEAIRIGDNLADVYGKLGTPLHAWSWDSRSESDAVRAFSTPSRSIIEAEMLRPGTVVSLRYSAPKVGSDHYQLYFVKIKNGSVIAKGGPIDQD